MIINVELRERDLPLILAALRTQLRLLGSYINKSQYDQERIARFGELLSRLERIELEQ